jgi:acyl phosphate:glycerol-3-phosphate acyltransferase
MHALLPLSNSTNAISTISQAPISIAAILIIAYLIGSINSAIILCKVCGYPSPLSEGSHNPGATNVMRIAGKKLAAVTLICDALKGFIPVIICHFIFGLPNLLLAAIALLAILGHIFPIFFRFRGGKGVATFLGSLIAINLWVAIITILTWLIIAKPLRISSLATIITSVLCPFYTWFFVSGQLAWAIAIICVIIILRHHGNIRRLLSGEESSFKK